MLPACFSVCACTLSASLIASCLVHPPPHLAVLDVASGKVAHTLAGHSGGTNGLAFLSGNSLASVGEDGCARLWNVARGSCLHELAVDAEGADRCAALRR